MFIDLVGYTRKTSSKSRENFIELLDTYSNIVTPIFPEFEGEIIKGIGDSYLVTFESPTNAVICGIALQNAMAAHNKDKQKKDQIHIKVAISSGEVHLRNNDVYGDAVNIAARIEHLTKPGKIYLNESVYLSMNRNDISLGFVGKRKGKGIKGRMNIYSVLGKYDKIKIRRKQKKKKQVKKMKGLALFMIFFFIAIMALVWFFLQYANIL